MFLRLKHKKLDFFRIFYRSVGVVLSVPNSFYKLHIFYRKAFA